jgi:hypothetical protein
MAQELQTKVSATFSRGIGQWIGTSEVYSGDGRFVGHAIDQRHVQPIDANHLRIDLSFTGPLMLSGHYIIETRGRHRLYRGPVNVGFAETFDEGLVDADNYWPHWGLSQRFFLYVTPDQNHQFALTLMSRGEQLTYVIVGEFMRAAADARGPVALHSSLVLPGIPADRVNDPTNGRGQLLIHRSGIWAGELKALDAALNPQGTYAYRQVTHSDSDSTLVMQVEGEVPMLSPYRVTLHTNYWQAWTPAGDVVGSYTLIGGRALSGQFHHLKDELRVWRREVVSADGLLKVVVNVLYQGGVRVGVQHGVLQWEGA